jgi:hypothetical protein
VARRRGSPLRRSGGRGLTTAAGSLEEALAELRAEWGIQARPVCELVRLLAAGRPETVDRLVAATALSHRSVTAALRRLEPWLESGPAGHRLAEAPPGGALEIPAEEGPAGAALDERLAGIEAFAPPRRRDLDHVAATAGTRLRRAAFMAERYDLDGARVLCLGDHDLTAPALALAAPGARVAVVDVDDEVLERVDGAARSLDVEVACRFADLRVGLPPALRGWADLVFADPPYTPEGVRLFAQRGCEALRRDDRTRLLLCYGHGERQPALGLKVQSVLHSLRLLIEEVRPGFNRYAGAQAIGGASALYVTRPGPATWQAVDRSPAPDARIYTHGPMAVEAARRALPEAVARELPDPVPAAELWRLGERHAIARPERRPRLPEPAAADLSLEPALALRLLLLHRGRRLRMALPEAEAAALLAPGGWRSSLAGAAYHVREVVRAGGLAVVEAERRDDLVEGAELLARHIVSHPAAAVASSLREGLIAAGAARTQNEARALAARVRGGEARPPDMPLHDLRALAEALPLLVGMVDGQSV